MPLSTFRSVRLLGPLAAAAALGIGAIPSLAQSAPTTMNAATPDCSEIRFDLSNPSPGSMLQSGALVLQGVASDVRSQQGSGIDRVDFFLDNREQGGASLGSVVPGVNPGPYGPTSFQTTVTLPNVTGGHDLVAYAHSTVNGSESVISVPVAINEDPSKAFANSTGEFTADSCTGGGQAAPMTTTGSTLGTGLPSTSTSGTGSQSTTSTPAMGSWSTTSTSGSGSSSTASIPGTGSSAATSSPAGMPSSLTASATSPSTSMPSSASSTTPAMTTGAATTTTLMPSLATVNLKVGNPSPGDTIHVGGYTIEGTALDQAAQQGSGIDHIDIVLDNRDQGGMALGQAMVGDGNVWRTTVTLPSNATGLHELWFYAYSSLSGQAASVGIPVTIAP